MNSQPPTLWPQGLEKPHYLMQSSGFRFLIVGLSIHVSPGTVKLKKEILVRAGVPITLDKCMWAGIGSSALADLQCVSLLAPRAL